jgi:sulfite reductase beta subunit-like hemoprotein
MSELEKVEITKAESKGLRGTIEETLKSGVDGFDEDDKQLLKFHGMYQQKLRGNDIPEEKKNHSFMLRGRIPGGRLTADQYIKWDELGDLYGGNALRLTTRQSIQLHGIIKANIKETIQQIHKMHLSTMGACGDVVRNVTQAVNPSGEPKRASLDTVAELLSEHFKYKSHGYAEIWLDEEKVTEDPIDPIYGKTYLPRKFKIAVTVVGDNSIDIYTNDMAFAATFTNDTIDGYFVFAGGGLGMTHNKPNTFPRKADLLGWISVDQLIPVSEAIVTSHRDFGDRTNRKHARLKYVLEEKGVEWFRKEVETRSGCKFDTKKTLPVWNTPSYLGWIKRIDGTFSLGFHTLSGRIKDFPNMPLKSAIKEIVSTYRLDVQLTADQDLILLGVKEADISKINARLKELNVDPNVPNAFYARALACPALPTCALALTESERVLPDVLQKLQPLLEKYNLLEIAPLLRMTGCPNGCARPYTAEIGLVGQQSGGKYAVYLGGDHEGTRVGTRFVDKMNLDDMYTMFDKLFKLWNEEAEKNERFGEYVVRKTPEKLKELIM